MTGIDGGELVRASLAAAFVLWAVADGKREIDFLAMSNFIATGQRP